MGGAPCKLLLNSGGVIGTLTGISNLMISDQASTVPADLVSEGEDLICGFHKELLAYEAKILKATGYEPDEDGGPDDHEQ